MSRYTIACVATMVSLGVPAWGQSSTDSALIGAARWTIVSEAPRMDVGPQLSEIQFKQFEGYLAAAQYQNAISYLGSLPGATHSSSIQYHIGFAYRQQLQWDSAIAYYSRASQLAPQNPTYHLGLGIAYQQSERFAEAEHAIRRALRIDPGYANAWNSLGFTFRIQSRPREALEAYRAAQRAQINAVIREALPKRVQANAEVALSPEDWQRVSERLRKDRLYAIIMNNIGQALAALGQCASAEAAFREGIRYVPIDQDYPDIYDNLARLSCR